MRHVVDQLVRGLAIGGLTSLRLPEGRDASTGQGPFAGGQMLPSALHALLSNPSFQTPRPLPPQAPYAAGQPGLSDYLSRYQQQGAAVQAPPARGTPWMPPGGNVDTGPIMGSGLPGGFGEGDGGRSDGGGTAVAGGGFGLVGSGGGFGLGGNMGPGGSSALGNLGLTAAQAGRIGMTAGGPMGALAGYALGLASERGRASDPTQSTSVNAVNGMDAMSDSYGGFGPGGFGGSGTGAGGDGSGDGTGSGGDGAGGGQAGGDTGSDGSGGDGTGSGGQLAEGGLTAVGQYLRGPGDGMSDSIPAQVGGPQGRGIRVAANEFVVPADVVSHLGNGSSEAGASVLHRMGAQVRQARTGNPQQGRRINPSKFVPA